MDMQILSPKLVLLGHYDKFVATHCNRVDNGVQKIEETADLITMGLF